MAAASGAAYLGSQFYDAARDYDLAFMRFKALNLGDEINKQADAFVRGTRHFGVSNIELMKMLSESNLARYLESYPVLKALYYAKQRLMRLLLLKTLKRKRQQDVASLAGVDRSVR